VVVASNGLGLFVVVGLEVVLVASLTVELVLVADFVVVEGNPDFKSGTVSSKVEHYGTLYIKKR
jgi:hypothetical protein